MGSDRWIGAEVFVYRHPVDMRIFNWQNWGVLHW